MMITTLGKEHSRSGLEGPTNYHKCHKCSFKTTLTVRMTSHVMTHNFLKQQRLFSCVNSIESLNCSQCPNFQTDKLADLKHHIKAGHTLKESKEKLYECENCTLQTYSNLIYFRHKLLNMCLTNQKVKFEEAVPSGSNEFQIGDESVTDSKVSKIGDSFDLKRHSTRHLSDFCDFESETKQILLDHTQLCQRLDRFQCDNCSYKTSSKSLLDYHSTKKHKFAKSQFRKCEHCPYRTKRIDGLKRHNLWKHTDPKNIQWFECEHCSFKSKTKCDLKRHTVKHTNADEIQWLKCKYCSFKCKRKGNLKNHILMKHTPTDEIQWFQCEDCPYKSKKKWRLKEHIQVNHTAADEIQWYKCEDCSFKSIRKADLKSHIMFKHTDALKIQWFQCEDCSYKSKTKWHLKRHIVAKHTSPDEIQ